ncbi:MAG: cell envelope integrity EipB family protein [Hyphomicrobiaceae bacterium]
MKFVLAPVAIAATAVIGAELLALLVVSTAGAAPAGQAIQFAPHRAVYDITLERAASGSGIIELTGRMVYDLQGSACEGFTQNMRFVTRMMSQDGSEQINDLRTSSWEQSEGRRLRFSSAQYRDRELVDSANGDARRRDGAVAVDVTTPKPAKIQLPRDVYFPMQHSAALVSAARDGLHQFVADLYDGSEKGVKVYRTSAMIGDRMSTHGLPARLANSETLMKVPSWPVAISYFEDGALNRDAVPSYELSFNIFENGVSSRLVIDYGDFAVRGELSDLTYYASSDCPAASQGVEPKRP